MKKVFAVIIAIMLFALCGCSGQKTYSLEKVQKAVDDFFDMEYTVPEFNYNEIYGVDSGIEIYIDGYDYDVKFYDLSINVFDKEEEAKAYLEKFKNNEFDYIYTLKRNCGDNYCLTTDNRFEDVMAEMYICQKRNVTISVRAMYDGYGDDIAEKNFNSFIENDIPKFFAELD